MRLNGQSMGGVGLRLAGNPARSVRTATGGLSLKLSKGLAGQKPMAQIQKAKTQKGSGKGSKAKTSQVQQLQKKKQSLLKQMQKKLAQLRKQGADPKQVKQAEQQYQAQLKMLDGQIATAQKQEAKLAATKSNYAANGQRAQASGQPSTLNLAL